MNTDVKNRIQVKIFVGLQLLPEIYHHLNQSQAWKEAQTTPAEDDLRVVHHQGKDFCGVYAPEDKISFVELALLEERMKSKLRDYCPKLNAASYQTAIFSQVFIP